MRKITLLTVLALALVVFVMRCKPDANLPVKADGNNVDGTAPRSVYTPSGYKLAISDDFNGSSVDTAIWGYGTTGWGGESGSSKCSLARPVDTYLSGGTLVERATKTNVTGPSGTAYNYTCGWTWTKQRLAYGYIEIRASYPNSRGAWPAFWMLKDGWPPEIDIDEYRGNPKNYMTHAFYDGTWHTKNTHDTGGSFTGYHTYGLLWEPGSLKWYIDGTLVHSYAGSSVPSDPMYVTMSNGVACQDADGTGFPNYFTIDYFRWYQKPATAPISQGKTATASTSQSDQDASQGNDGDFSTRWNAASGTFPQWWKVDLGSNKTVSKANIEWYHASDRAYQYKIETSTDNVNFTTRLDKTGNTNSGVSTDTFSAVTARYIRVTVTGCNTSGAWAGFQEFQAF